MSLTAGNSSHQIPTLNCDWTFGIGAYGFTIYFHFNLNVFFGK